MTSLDMSPAAVTARLREVNRAADLSSDHRLHYKIDYSAAAVTGRLRKVAALRRLCLAVRAGGAQKGAQ